MRIRLGLSHKIYIILFRTVVLLGLFGVGAESYSMPNQCWRQLQWPKLEQWRKQNGFFEEPMLILETSGGPLTMKYQALMALSFAPETLSLHLELMDQAKKLSSSLQRKYPKSFLTRDSLPKQAQNTIDKLMLEYPETATLNALAEADNLEKMIYFLLNRFESNLDIRYYLMQTDPFQLRYIGHGVIWGHTNDTNGKEWGSYNQYGLILESIRKHYRIRQKKYEMIVNQFVDPKKHGFLTSLLKTIPVYSSDQIKLIERGTRSFSMLPWARGGMVSAIREGDRLAFRAYDEILNWPLRGENEKVATGHLKSYKMFIRQALRMAIDHNQEGIVEEMAELDLDLHHLAFESRDNEAAEITPYQLARSLHRTTILKILNQSFRDPSKL